MKTLFWVIALFALAVGLIVAARYNSGYMLVVLPPYRIELSLSFALLLLAAAFFLGYGALRIAVNMLDLPAKARNHRMLKRQEQGRALLNKAISAFFSGRYAEAEKSAAAALELGVAPELSGVLAARAAHGLKATERREHYLAQVEIVDVDQAPRMMAQAEFLLEERHPEAALVVLDQLNDKQAATLRLKLRAQQRLQNWEQVLSLTATLHSQGGLSEPQAEELRRLAHAETLKRCDRATLAARWQDIAEPDQLDGYVAVTAARAFLGFEQFTVARDIIERSLLHEWEDHLVALYPDCAGNDAAPLLDWAEKQLARHRGEPVLLLALGRLCMQQNLLDKARDYLEASLANETTHSAHLALAQLHERLGHAQEASAHYRLGLEQALVQLKNSSGWRRRTAL